MNIRRSVITVTRLHKGCTGISELGGCIFGWLFGDKRDVDEHCVNGMLMNSRFGVLTFFSFKYASALLCVYIYMHIL